MTETIAYSPDHSIAVSSIAVYDSTKSKAPKATVDKESRDSNALDYHPWGADGADDYPQKVREALEGNSDLASSLDWLARTLYAGGIGYRLIDPATGKELENQYDAGIEKFLKRNWFYPISACKEFYKFINVFPEMIISKGGTEFVWLYCRPSAHCRLAVQNADGEIKQAYVNANFSSTMGGAVMKDDKETLKLDFIDLERIDVESFKELGAEKLKNKSVMARLRYPSDYVYYSLADWNALKKENGWLDLANEIPKFKMSVMKNQMTVKYLIEFSEQFWLWKYPDWNERDAAKRAAARKETYALFDEFLKGSENAAKSLKCTFAFDPHTKVEIPGVRITPIDDKIKDGMYLEDGSAATIKIFSALGIDPTLFGIIPGKGGTNRSGSDKREALNIHMSLVKIHQHIILRPYDFISDFNGWNTDEQLVEWYFKQPTLQTLDQVTPKKRDVQHAEDVEE